MKHEEEREREEKNCLFSVSFSLLKKRKKNKKNLKQFYFNIYNFLCVNVLCLIKLGF